MQTESTLDLMAEALQKFNDLKDVFADVSPSSLRFPKMHALTHYIHFIRRYGTLDNFDMEYTEHAHIISVKVPYQGSNKRNVLPQIIQHVLRGQAIQRKMDILESMSDPPTTNNKPVDFTSYILSSKITEGRLTVNEVETLFKLPGLEMALRTFFYDIISEAGPGIRKRYKVSKQRLPSLDNDTVSYFYYHCGYFWEYIC